MKFKAGDHVMHAGHGHGKVVGYNQRPKNNYFEERPKEVIVAVKKSSILIRGLVDSLYDGERYPYVVKFDDGYQDVYSESDLTPAPTAVDNGDGTGSLKGKLVGMGF